MVLLVGTTAIEHRRTKGDKEMEVSSNNNLSLLCSSRSCSCLRSAVGVPSPKSQLTGKWNLGS